jgi:hypothetical protein
MPGPVQVYDTGVEVVEAMALTVVVVQLRLPVAEEATAGVAVFCVTAREPMALQPLEVLVIV